MQKATIFCLLLSLSITAGAQNYYLSFSGSGASSTVDSVTIDNITQNKQQTFSGTDTVYLVWIVNSEEVTHKPDFSLFPNPMEHSSNLVLNSRSSSPLRFDIYDLTGRHVIRWESLLFPGANHYEISGLAAGAYVLNIQGNNFHLATKLISLNPGKTEPMMKQAESHTNSQSRRLRKQAKNIIQMQYTNGDKLLLTGMSGNYARVVYLHPTQSQTVNFEFVACTDGDGNRYPVVTIGTQTWMGENLKTTKYSDGTPVPLVTDSLAWSIYLTTPAYCWVKNNQALYGNSYGALYNWYAVNTANLCPAGWRVPAQPDFALLVNYLGGSSVASGKLKETGTTHWDNPNSGATNLYGFSGRGSGYRNIYGFSGFRTYLYFWTATEADSSQAFSQYLSSNSSATHLVSFNKAQAYSVRCIKN